MSFFTLKSVAYHKIGKTINLYEQIGNLDQKTRMYEFLIPMDLTLDDSVFFFTL